MMDTIQQYADVEGQSSDRTEDEIEVVEITLSSSEPEYSPQKQPEPEVTTPERLGVAQIKREAENISLLAEIYKRGGSVFASSGSDESVGAFCSRKFAAMCSQGKKDAPDVLSAPPKVSISEPIELNPTVPPAKPITEVHEREPENLSLATPPVHSNVRDQGQGSKHPNSKVNISALPMEFTFAPAREHSVVSGASASSPIDSQSRATSGEDVPMSCNEAEVPAISDPESVQPKRSTLADAITAPVKNFAPALSESSYVSPEEAIHRTGGPAPLSINSQELIRTYFEKTPSFNLPQGHPTVALNQEQIGHILRIVADETARASFEMLNSVVIRASQLSLSDSPSASKGPMHRPVSLRSCSTGSEGDLTSYGVEDSGRDVNSRGATSEGEFWSDIDPGHCSSRLSAVQIPSPPVASSSRVDPAVTPNSATCESPGNQTLAELKQEAAKTKGKGQKKPAPKVKPKNPRKAVARSSRILRDEMLDGMAWTRTFVSGPMDPKWNPYKFYCQICKGNISIYGRGAKEILRHHSTERHLRKDQRWRYEHLTVEDPVTKVIHHHVRDSKGLILSPKDLRREYEHFKKAELIDIGEKLPYYHEAMAGITHMTSSSDNRVRVQISVLGHFLPSIGDLGLLRRLWKDVGVVVNHQALFSDFNWGKERLSVCNFTMIKPTLFNLRRPIS